MAKCTAGAATRYYLAAASLAAEVVVVEAEATIGWRAGKGLTGKVGVGNGRFHITSGSPL